VAEEHDQLVSLLREVELARQPAKLRIVEVAVGGAVADNAAFADRVERDEAEAWLRAPRVVGAGAPEAAFSWGSTKPNPWPSA
jgi:hypothetical protein